MKTRTLSWRCRVFVLAFLCAFVSASPALSQNTTQPARDDGVQRTLQTDGRIAVTDGGSLVRGVSNVMVDRWGQCRWLDNNNPSDDYFIPTGNATDWQAFIDNAPAAVRVDTCCPARSVDLTASDGQIFTVHLGVGRDGSTGALGRQTLSHTFRVVRVADGATWDETINAEYTCQGGAWTNTSTTTTGGPGGWDTTAWSACSAACDGTQTRTVTCKDSNGNVVADAMCGGAKPAESQPCNVGLCVGGDNGVCGTAANGAFDRSTPPPAATALTLCSVGTPTTPVRSSAITWSWQCQGTTTTATCGAARLGAAVMVPTDCRPHGQNSPPQSQWHYASNYYTYVCGVDRRMPENTALTPAHWAIPQMVNNYAAKYSCNKAGYPNVIGSVTAGSDWHRAYYTSWAPRAGTTGAGLDDNANYYMTGRGDQCEGCVVLDKVYCTDEPDYPAGCSPETGVSYMIIPPPAACEPARQHDDGALPFGHYGQVTRLGSTIFTCGLHGWVSSGVYNPTSRDRNTNVQCW